MSWRGKKEEKVNTNKRDIDKDLMCKMEDDRMVLDDS